MPRSRLDRLLIAVASVAKAEWNTTAKARLDELERVHREARGTGPVRRWGTEQLNRSLFIVLLAQFQTYCRALHDEAVDVHLAAANPRQADVLRALLTHGRQLDNKNPRSGALGSDFGRLGIELVPKLKAVGQHLAEALESLEVMVDFRNAIVHGNESEVAALVASGRVKATLTSYRGYRRTLGRLVGTMDEVVSAELVSELQIAAPW